MHGYPTILGEFVDIQAQLNLNFLGPFLRQMEQVYFILLPVRTCIRICIPGVKAVIHSIP